MDLTAMRSRQVAWFEFHDEWLIGHGVGQSRYTIIYAGVIPLCMREFYHESEHLEAHRDAVQLSILVWAEGCAIVSIHFIIQLTLHL